MADAPAGGSQLTLNVSTPNATLAKGAADWVVVPSTQGLLTVYPQHVPTIAELRAGPVLVARGNETSKYFISGGFLTVNADSTVSVSAIEGVPFGELDLDAVKLTLDKKRAEFSTATNEEAKATAEIQVETLEAVLSAASL
jgi:F-type H+-transporting ATPase subunit delta